MQASWKGSHHAGTKQLAAPSLAPQVPRVVLSVRPSSDQPLPVSRRHVLVLAAAAPAVSALASSSCCCGCSTADHDRCSSSTSSSAAWCAPALRRGRRRPTAAAQCTSSGGGSSSSAAAGTPSGTSAAPPALPLIPHASPVAATTSQPSPSPPASTSATTLPATPQSASAQPSSPLTAAQEGDTQRTQLGLQWQRQQQRLQPGRQEGAGPPSAAVFATSSSAEPPTPGPPGKRVIPAFAYPAAERSQIRESWETLMRWSKVFRRSRNGQSPLEATTKIVVFGGGSFGTAMAAALATQKPELEVVLLLRDPQLASDINTQHCNTKYLKDFTLSPNVTATTVAADAIRGAQYAVHAVPVQSSRAFLKGIKDLLPPSVPVICVSKGLEARTGDMMSDLIPSALERRQPSVILSGPSFAREVMQNRPTGLVAASRDIELARTVQALFASPIMRVNTTSDVVGVEICGALKNVLAIAAGIVEGLDLGNNAMAALLTQGCNEIRWLAEKTGAKPTTVSGLSGLGDIMLTCYGDLSRNRSVGIRLGRGEKLADIIASSSQVAEGIATAGVVVRLARKYRVSLPVLTAVAQVLDNALTPHEAVFHVMNLPQIDEA